MMIDSLQMTAADRGLILERCRSAPETRIVITHGTDTMAETAAVLGAGLRGKTVVLTGAMVPYTFGSSDGMFNLGTALAFVQTLGEGVYVAMNGRCFPWNSVRKDQEKRHLRVRDTDVVKCPDPHGQDYLSASCQVF